MCKIKPLSNIFGCYLSAIKTITLEHFSQNQGCLLWFWFGSFYAMEITVGLGQTGSWILKVVEDDTWRRQLMSTTLVHWFTPTPQVNNTSDACLSLNRFFRLSLSLSSLSLFSLSEWRNWGVSSAIVTRVAISLVCGTWTLWWWMVWELIQTPALPVMKVRLKAGSQYDAKQCVVLRHLRVDACRNATRR